MMDPSPTSRFISSNIETSSNLEHVVLNFQYNNTSQYQTSWDRLYESSLTMLSSTIDGKCNSKNTSSQCCGCLLCKGQKHAVQASTDLQKSLKFSNIVVTLDIPCNNIELMKLLEMLDSAPEQIWQLILLFSKEQAGNS